MTVPRRYAVVLPAYLAALLALDTRVSLHGQLALGALTFIVLAVALRPLAPLVRAQAVGVVLFATIGEVTGSLVWGVYHYRLHNLPLFIPPAHGLVYLSGIALSRSLRARAVVWAAAVGATAWGIAGLTVLPRLDVAGALGVPLLLVFLWRSSSRATYAGVFLAVAALELYGTSIGTWRWSSVAARSRDLRRESAERRRERLRLVRRDGAARRAVARLRAAGTLNPKRWSLSSGAFLSSIRRREPIGTMSASGASSSRASVDVERHHPESRLRLDPIEDEARPVGELDLDERLLDACRLGERRDRLVEPLDERLVRQLGVRRPELGHALTLAPRPISTSRSTTSASGRVASISCVHVARSSGSTSRRCSRISSRCSADFP